MEIKAGDKIVIEDYMSGAQKVVTVTDIYKCEESIFYDNPKDIIYKVNHKNQYESKSHCELINEDIVIGIVKSIK